MSDAGAKLAVAVRAGEFFCEVCGRSVDMNGASGFEQARERVLAHAEAHHE